MVSCSCCGCRGSLKAVSVLIVCIAIFIKWINPLLDDWIVPLEKKEERSSNNDVVFDATKTDVLNYTGFGFLKPEKTEAQLHMGLTFILRQSFPRWFIKLLEQYEPPLNTKENYDDHNVDILDARKRSDELFFHDTGFTLIDMGGNADSLSTVQNWRSQQYIQPFQQELEPHLRQLFPDATRIEFTYNVVRGGDRFGDQPAAINAPHLDYTQNDTARSLFHEEYPPFDQAKEHALLLGRHDTNDEELQALLGIWKPIGMTTPICDHPLALMDARNFSPQHEALFPVHIDFGVFTFHNLNGAIRHDPQQQWYYYPFQTDSEVLVFTQYTRVKHFCNPHGSFENPNCPTKGEEDVFDSRVSVEMRAAVFRKKDQKKRSPQR